MLIMHLLERNTEKEEVFLEYLMPMPGNAKLINVINSFQASNCQHCIVI